MDILKSGGILPQLRNCKTPRNEPVRDRALPVHHIEVSQVGKP